MAESIKALLLMLVFLGFNLPSFAQSETAKLQKLAKGADVIVTGRVIEKKSSWNENKTRIYTRTTLQVDEYLKGKGNGNSVEVTYPGGEVGDLGEIYTHMPRFEDQEEVLVFLKKDKNPKGFKVFNGESGKITMVRDLKTNEKMTTSKIRIADLESLIKKYVTEE